MFENAVLCKNISDLVCDNKSLNTFSGIMTELDGIVERYNEMKQELEDLHLANLSERDVANIVQEFKNEINSVRVMSHIRDLRGVMLILEARRILQPENPWALEKISQIVDRPFGLERIKHYNRYLQAKILLNQNSPPKPDGETNCKLKLVDEGISLCLLFL